MAKNAIVIRNKSSSYYNASRPLHSLLADGTAAGITGALKNTGAGSTLIGGFGPDGGSAVANWKTAPWGASRNTLYSGGTLAIGSVTGWAIVETPHSWRLIVESSGPVASADCFKFGEVVIGLDSTLGESATYGNADGRTMYGMMALSPTFASTTSTSETYLNPSGQSRCFIGAESTPRVIGTPYADMSGGFTSALMVPAGYGTGDWVVAGEFVLAILSSFRIGYPAYDQACKQGAYWSTLTVGAQTCRRLGTSTTTSYVVTTPYRKPGASADTLVHSRTVATYATWTDFLQAVWDYFAAGTYWEQDSSA